MSPRIYDQSAVIPYRVTRRGIEVLLVTTTSGQRWTLPKGIVEDDLTPAESAAKEAYEEGGIRGSVDSEAVGEYAYAKWGGTCHVRVYPMHVDEMLAHWDEEHFRRRTWLPLAEAADLVHDPGQRRILLHFGSKHRP